MGLDPESSGDAEILPDNIRAVQAIYSAFELENLRIFQVVDHLVDLFERGLLPIGKGAAKEIARRRAGGSQLTQAERADLYTRVLGAPGGNADDTEPNCEFRSLWLRFLAAVDAFANGPNAGAPVPLSVPGIRSAAKALAANASSHGYGVAFHAAASLHDSVAAAIELLGDPEVTQAFGARDMWQVIDQVNRSSLGGAVDVSRYRTQAQAGALVLRWLAARTTDPGSDTNPSDAELIAAAGQWLAAAGAPGDAPSSVAGELLERLGLIGAIALRKVALFHGAPGTGKTFAAHAVASALARQVLRVDLSRLVGKYIGETEKNLETVFARARETGAILLFDEADALFGERSAVKDAHDRFANLEIAYLLQRIEQYDGVVIFESNVEPRADACAGITDVVPFPWPRRQRG